MNRDRGSFIAINTVDTGVPNHVYDAIECWLVGVRGTEDTVLINRSFDEALRGADEAGS